MKKRFFFNNCQGRDHRSLYGDGVLYDLDTDDQMAAIVTEIEEGDECVVATRAPDEDHGPGGIIDFGWFIFSHQKLLPVPDEVGTRCYVFFGEKFRCEQFSKSKAAKTELYRIFFNRLGHFKRQNVLRPM
jgi:hypothetical protein